MLLASFGVGGGGPLRSSRRLFLAFKPQRHMNNAYAGDGDDDGDVGDGWLYK